MNKKLIYFSSVIFGIAGSYIAAALGDEGFLGGWSVLGGLIGGLFGVWVGVVVSRRWG